MIDWREALEYYFVGWFGDDDVPHTLTRALDRTVGDKDLDFVYPIGALDGPGAKDDRRSFLVVAETDPFLVHFDPPSTTTVVFVGSLAGGLYSESTEDGTVVRGVFAHPRLGSEDPIQVTSYQPPPPPPGDQARWFYEKGQKAAWHTFDDVRDALRRWSTEPPHHPAHLG